MKDRELVCEFYICEGQCKKGKAGTFRDACQHCDGYRPVRGSRPARIDNRKKKMDKIMRKEKWD